MLLSGSNCTQKDREAQTCKNIYSNHSDTTWDDLTPIWPHQQHVTITVRGEETHKVMTLFCILCREMMRHVCDTLKRNDVTGKKTLTSKTFGAQIHSFTGAAKQERVYITFTYWDIFSLFCKNKYLVVMLAGLRTILNIVTLTCGWNQTGDRSFV